MNERECPYCAMMIGATEKKCPHCQEILDRSAAAPHVKWVGNLAVFAPEASFSMSRCAICGGTENVQPWRKKYYYTPMILILIAVFVCLILAVILCLFIQKQGIVNLPRCGSCRKRTIWTNVGIALTLIVGIVAFPTIGWMIGEATGTPDGVGWGIGIGVLVWVFALIGAVIASSRVNVTCRKIDDTGITLKFPRPEVTRSVLSSGEEA